jgi:plasmid stabilization system protein ParE
MSDMRRAYYHFLTRKSQGFYSDSNTFCLQLKESALFIYVHHGRLKAPPAQRRFLAGDVDIFPHLLKFPPIPNAFPVNRGERRGIIYGYPLISRTAHTVCGVASRGGDMQIPPRAASSFVRFVLSRI